ncbi:MAG TPA: DEAD/DEAH box helicase [Gemmataceae bacterium]|nr:DEAD/DEAH box helicase [Gemmataceae bacterium]
METPLEGLEFIDAPPASSWLDQVPEGIASWFRRRYGEPTPIQRAAWSRRPAGQHLLLNAPTGTGKTLAAFLPILTHLIQRGKQEGPAVACLYVSPLKALSADTERTLRAHLEELSTVLPADSLPRLAVRSGDTTAAERRQMRRYPPDILLTTPESVAVLLSQPMARRLFADLRWVVVDEVHALAASKRGADLALSLERLTELADSRLQRIGLSATATPVTAAARWLAPDGCAIAQAGEETRLQLTLVPLEESGHFLANLVDRLMPEVRGNRATLVFTNSRRLAEQLGWALRRNLPEMAGQIAVHHSSLAAERRREVEAGFKQGRLRAVISSTSLELGIDIGVIDLAVLVHPPGDVIRLLQRVGRAGHGPERVQRGLVLTATDAELLEAAVTAASGQAGQCEPLRIPVHPLDVLCQHILGMAAAQTCSADRMYDLVRRAAPYRNLPCRDFEDCLAYLGCRPTDGEPGEERPWLPPRLRGNPASFTLLNQRTARLLRRNLGTILADPAYEVWMSASVGQRASRRSAEKPLDESSLIGQVDRSFAERLRPGDRFLLDGRCLQVRSLRPEESLLRVEEVAGRPIVPRWGGEGWPLSTALAERLYLLRIQAAEALRDGPDALARLLQHDYGLEDAAVAALTAFFQRQECISEIPDSTSCLIEIITHEDGADYYVHTPLNRLGNDALARVAVHRLARDHCRGADSLVADLGFALLIHGDLDGDGSRIAETLRSLLAASDFEADLNAALEGSAILRECFQRVAQTGLMLLRQPLGQTRRVGGRDWAARRLFDKIQAHDRDFVLLRQARREAHSEWCDAAAAVRYVRELQRLPLRCRHLTYPSPFVESWTQAGAGAVERVETPAEVLLRLHASLTERKSNARPADMAGLG